MVNNKNNNKFEKDESKKTFFKFLFVSLESLSGDLAFTLVREGHKVKCYIKNPDDADVYDGFLDKVNDWKELVDWADVILYMQPSHNARLQSLYGVSILTKIRCLSSYCQTSLRKIPDPAFGTDEDLRRICLMIKEGVQGFKEAYGSY